MDNGDKEQRSPTQRAHNLPATTLIQLPAFLADAVLRQNPGAAASVTTTAGADGDHPPRAVSPTTALAHIRHSLSPHALAALTQTPTHPPQLSQGGPSSLPGTPPSPTAADLNIDPRQRLIEQLLPHIPAEATEILYDAGYETLDAIRQLNVNLADPNNDLTSAELYTKKTLKPGHKKLIFQYVQNPPYGFDPSDPNASVLAALNASSRKRRRMNEDISQINSPNDLPALLTSLERHLAESPVTRTLRKDVDYRVGVELSRDGRGAEGVWKCLVCSSRPVTIALRNGGRQPQLSNVSTHLKTVKHTGALTQRGVSFLTAAQQQGNGTPQGEHGNPAALAAAAIAAAGASGHQHSSHPQHNPFQSGHSQTEESE
ncbi:hypothetical protein HDV00_000808 [Rhizophlyctis rosea]|nr:hypothetical protein HDV00_000808 [Rhizophlyctis rosea]